MIFQRTSFYTVDLPQNNENGPLMMEQILSALHKQKKKGSLEVWARRGKIQFAIFGETEFQSLLESHYPGIRIQKKTDYAEKLKGKAVFLRHLVLDSAPIFPVRRYSMTADWIKRRWTDPYLTILSSLKNLCSGEIRGIQLIFSPLPLSWRKKGTDTLSVYNRISSWWLFQRWWWLKKQLMKVIYNCWLLRIILLLVIPPKSLKTPDGIDHRTHSRETVYEACRSKLSQIGFKVAIRLIYSGKESGASPVLQEMAGSFGQFTIDELNEFKPTAMIKAYHRCLRIVKKRTLSPSVTLSVEELSGILALPGNEVKITELRRAAFKPVSKDIFMDDGVMVGKTVPGNQLIRLSPKDVQKHISIIGKSGMGKSTFIFSLLKELILAHEGVALLDPHGDLLSQVIDIIPKDRIKDTIFIDPTDIEYPVAFNVLQADLKRKDHIIASVVDIFYNLYKNFWGPRTDYILSQSVSALIVSPDASLLGIPRILLDEQYRKKCLKYVKDPIVLEFWQKEYRRMPARLRIESIAPILNKINRFLMVPVIRNILGQRENRINLREIMDTGKILLINLSKGFLGEENSSLLGNFFLAHLQLSALSRADTQERPHFSVFVDELQHFVSACASHVETLYSEGRKYGLNLVTACQYLSQLGEHLVETIFGNVNTMVCYGIGHSDACKVAPYLKDIDPDDLINLPPYHGYLRYMKESAEVVSFRNIPPSINGAHQSQKNKVQKYSRSRYARDQKEVEDEIARFFKPKLII